MSLPDDVVGDDCHAIFVFWSGTALQPGPTSIDGNEGMNTTGAIITHFHQEFGIELKKTKMKPVQYFTLKNLLAIPVRHRRRSKNTIRFMILLVTRFLVDKTVGFLQWTKLKRAANNGMNSFVSNSCFVKKLFLSSTIYIYLYEGLHYQPLSFFATAWLLLNISAFGYQFFSPLLYRRKSERERVLGSPTRATNEKYYYQDNSFSLSLCVSCMHLNQLLSS